MFFYICHIFLCRFWKVIPTTSIGDVTFPAVKIFDDRFCIFQCGREREPVSLLTVQSDEKDVWTGPPTEGYRVSDVLVLDRETGDYEPLDLTAEYHLAGYNYTLRDLGGGFAMLDGAANVLDYVAEDYMVLANYIQSFPVSESTGLPTIGAGSV